MQKFLMAEEKGKNILTAPPMNPPRRSWPFGEHYGCDGDGCASDRDTWPLHHVYRRGVRCHRLCSSCILLSKRSLYCCCCFFLIPSDSPSSHCDGGDPDPLMAPPAPTVTCQVCRDAVAHLGCLYHSDGVFVCPPCNAAAMGRSFTYAPPCREPLDVRAARILVLGARIALQLLRSNAAAARAEAERLAQEARAARTRASHALSVFLDLNEEAASEEGSEANVECPMPPLSALTIGTEGFRAVPMAPGEASRAQPWSLPQFGVNDVTMAAAEAARASPPTPRTLQLFPAAKGSTSPKMPQTMQLFEDKIPDDEEEM